MLKPVPGSSAGDHADGGFAYSKLSGEIPSTLPGFVSGPNLLHLSFGQLGIPVPAPSIGGTVPNPVGLLIGGSAVAEVGDTVVQHPGGSMPNLLPFGARPQESQGNQKVNVMMSLCSVAISQLDLPVSAIRLGGMALSVLLHDATRSSPGVNVPASGLPQNDSVERANPTKIGNFIQSFVSPNG